MLFQNFAKPGFICIWCGAHQIGTVLQGSYSKFGGDAFYEKIICMISYLWRQQNLFSAMRSKEPKVTDTRWELVGKVRNWFNMNKIDIDMHVNEKQTDYAPLPIWYIHLMVVSEFSRIPTNTFKIIQDHHVTVAMQRTCLVSIHTYLLHAVGGDDPMSTLEASELDDSEWVLLECRLFSASIPKSKELITNQG